MIKDKIALSVAVMCGLCSLISGASDKERKRDFPGPSLFLALVAAFNVYVAF